MADLLSEARDKLIEGDGMDGATEDAGKGGMFCTGSGRSVALSDRAIRKARALVGEEAVETSNKRKQPFGDGVDFEGNLRETDVSFRGGVHKDITPPMFQTGSGKAVLLSKDSIRKARVVLEGNVENAACAIQPMFHTGMGRSVPISRGSISKARVVLGGQTIAKQDVAVVDGMEQFPLFQIGSGRAVSVSVASIQKAKAVLEENNTNEGNMEGFGRPDQSLTFQTGSRRPVLISERSTERSRAVVKEGGAENSGLGRHVAVCQTSIQKARTVLEEENIKRSGHGDNSVCATILQTETPRSVLTNSSLIMNDGTVTPEGDIAMQGHRFLKQGST